MDRFTPHFTALRRTGILAALLLMAGVTACSSTGSERMDARDWDGSRADVFHLRVENNNFNGARIYLIRDRAERRRLGVVNGKNTHTFQIELRNTADFQVEVDFIAGGGFVTPSLSVSPGETAELRIPAHAGD